MSKETQETPSRSEYTPEIGDRICEEIAEGRSVRDICAKEEWAPSRRVIYDWLRRHPEFEKNYRIAKQWGAEALVDQMLDAARNGSNDWMATNDPDNPGYRFNGEHVQRSRLHVDTLKWLASKMYPKMYGDRVTAELTGVDGGPIQTADVSETEIARRIAFTLAAGMKPQEKTH